MSAAFGVWVSLPGSLGFWHSERPIYELQHRSSFTRQEAEALVEKLNRTDRTGYKAGWCYEVRPLKTDVDERPRNDCTCGGAIQETVYGDRHLHGCPAAETGWRVGRQLGSGRTLYKDGRCVGIVDTPELAKELVDAANAALGK